MSTLSESRWSFTLPGMNRPHQTSDAEEADHSEVARKECRGAAATTGESDPAGAHSVDTIRRGETMAEHVNY